jgi:hypothetical protein
MSASRRALAAIFVIVACGDPTGCEGADATRSLPGRDDTDDSAFLAQQPWIGALELRRDQSRETFRCTAWLVAPKVAVTASHCLVGGWSQAEFTLGRNAYQPEQRITIAAFVRHPRLDIAVLRLADAPLTEAETIPGPDFRRVASEQLRMVGYGLAMGRMLGSKRSLEVLARPLADDLLALTSNPDAAPCRGDSGAPLLRLSPQSRWRPVAVLVRGGESCTGSDTAIPLAAVRSWLMSLLNDS